MRRRSRTSRGYSLAELLTIVAIIGVVVAVTVPAFTQLMPQYRIRSAASEMAATLKMLREKAVSTRMQWRMTVDPTNDRYFMERATAVGAAPSQLVGENGRDITDASVPDYKKYKRHASVDIVGSTNIVVTFNRDGTIASQQQITLGTNTQLVRFNRYTIQIDPSGNVTVRGWKT